jgi:hypothetical protein
MTKDDEEKRRSDEEKQKERAESIRRQIEELKSGKKDRTRPDQPTTPREWIDQQTDREPEGKAKED